MVYTLNPWVDVDADYHVRYQDFVDEVGLHEAKNHPEVRRLLQVYGTDVMRRQFGENVWVDLAYSGKDPADHWVVTDCRFKNEADGIRDHGGFVVRINRPGVEPPNLHPSEVDLLDYDFDYTIDNDGTLDDLTDVDTVTDPPDDGDFLVYDSATGEWVPATLVSSGGIPDPGGSNDDFMQRKSGAWTYRTPAQVKTDLGVTARLQAGFPTLSGGIGSDNWGLPPGCHATLTAATSSVGTGMAWVVPFSVDSDVTITAAAVRATATASGSVTRCAIVRLDNTLQPSSLVHEFTTFDTSSSGVKSQTGLSVALTPGIYATYTKTEVAAPTLVYMSGFINALMPMVATLSAGGGMSAVMTASIGAGAYANPPAGGALFNGTPLSLLFLRWTNP